MKMRRPFAVLMSLVAAAGPPQVAEACTRILWNTSGKVVMVARTMDLYRSDQATILVTPRGLTHRGLGQSTVAPWVTRYGSVQVTAGGVSASDGMNEKGLVVNLLYLSGTQYAKPDDRPTLANASVVAYLLDNFATVDDALAGLEKVRILSVTLLDRAWPMHISISDAKGDSAIIEFVNQQRIVHHGPGFTVMTNEPRIEDQLQNLGRYVTFGGVLPIPGGVDPSSRFVRASFFLKSLTPPTSTPDALAKIFSVINAEAVPFDAEEGLDPSEAEDKWPTLWTAVADSTHKVYYFRSSTSPFLYWVDLTKLRLDRGTKAHSVNAYDATLSGDITRMFPHR